MIHIVLVEPEIPQNTGNIARTCACTKSRLHLVRPLGFSVDEKSLRRAGLDYWDKVDVVYHDSLSAFFEDTRGGKYYYLSTKASRRYTDAAYPAECFLLFGKETKGLPESLIFDNPETALAIPMTGDLRSLNLSNAVAVVLYEALRQHGFSF
ncbi:MAG: tRNA (uridine(34)/cytosine(34)/5-carboxymethylaminomethyluridine(34)-2'-O)-methyltransferase TrmL [Clostridiales bacterium]|jgi:tRNA (cytidine/uridine-2'-O-)-methyltransferase|nr:tRNA (uridine(34)/cytosine(34)/5-carboxymethylaminomethyluridine(34)-2'-O)-methyltransferase TrmL [Clostridiales bacterium]